MINWIRNLIAKIKWVIQGKLMINYLGFHCGCCGRWWSIPFEVPTYESCGEWWDTWGLCLEGKGCWRGQGFLR